MKRVLKWIGIAVAVLIVVGVGGAMYAKSAAAARFEQKYDVPGKDLPIPFPLSKAEIAALEAERTQPKAKPTPTEDSEADSEPAAEAAEASAAETAAADAKIVQPQAADANTAKADAAQSDAGAEPAATDDALGAAEPARAPAPKAQKPNYDAIARQRAIARGKHYLESRAGCAECHGDDLGGKVIMDNPAMGKWIAPNITRGGKTKDYKPADWDRIIRHGLRPDGTAANMPSFDYALFSDQEVSDMAAYIHSLPAVDRVMPASELGPVMAFLIVKGDMPISAEIIDHKLERPMYPPTTAAASLALGEHLSHTCRGCHGMQLSGGPILGGDPAWPPAKNLTFHETGLETWSLEDFIKSMRDGVRPDGKKIDPVMPIAYTSRLKDAEIEALYLYLKSVEPRAYGGH